MAEGLPIRPLKSVAEEMGVSADLLKDWAKERAFPAYPVTREAWFVVVEDLGAWLRRHGNKAPGRKVAGKVQAQGR